ncbi:MAG: hypothetical protein H6696_09865 [Deferribacteres bacterium]|nr:hypothetical protein [candidate division KSB1 bacterium]MCB9502234.1 hypothetical protein [Deferribacteres bacterium]
MKRILVLLSTALLVMTTKAASQDIETSLARYTSTNGKKYAQPLADAFGANLNSGIYHSAKIPGLGLHIKISLEAMFTFVADDQKIFDAQLDDNSLFVPLDGSQQSYETATIFGGEGARVEGVAGTAYVFPSGFNVAKFPTTVPQITVGSFLGTEASLRWFKAKIGDIGELSLNGFGIRHSISQYLLLFPIDIAAHFNRQSFKFGDVIEASATSFGVEASKEFKVLGIYGGLALESANLDVKYTLENQLEEVDINFNLESDNSVRLTTGVSLNLPYFNIHADYNLGASNVVNLGIAIGR